MHTIHLPDQAYDLVCRISTPSNRGDGPKKVDPKYPTILLCHPLSMDSFIFYPQYDDPMMYKHFNLVAFDQPGHGFSYLKRPIEGEFTLDNAVEAIYLGLTALDIKRVNVVSTGTASGQAMHLISTHPELVESLTMVMPSAPRDMGFISDAFDEWMEHLRAAVLGDDLEALRLLSTSAFDFATEREGDPAMRELKEENLQLFNSKQAIGQMNLALPTFDCWVKTRGQLLSEAEARKVVVPVLIIHDKEEGTEAFGQMVGTINDACLASGRPIAATRLFLDNIARWATLSSPDRLNPILCQFIKTKSPPLISSSIDPTAPLSPTLTRRPSTPRDKSGFHIVRPRPELAPKRKSLGDVMEGLREKGETGGVVVEVEIMVKVDEVDGP
ncbi:hypothetical protein CI109_102548 [Kwoniella shandongensis]|uniref:Uncharacterized protein n=1 Tax=Kwoniella shandongensis TaxID=1734106 RepID=A0A5M6BSH2_9TREE|nr:uncharacterized protein CI109_005837 [Kwoniella shandongensis]KAA5525814.1 hypothetical protein CI109_005837 [Kwoniella shandongensis]